MFSKSKAKTKEINKLRDIQKKEISIYKGDDYIVGVHNGLELASAILEDREPVLETCVTKEPKTVDNTEQDNGRTLYSGIIRGQ